VRDVLQSIPVVILLLIATVLEVSGDARGVPSTVGVLTGHGTWRFPKHLT